MLSDKSMLCIWVKKTDLQGYNQGKILEQHAGAFPNTLAPIIGTNLVWLLKKI